MIFHSIGILHTYMQLQQRHSKPNDLKSINYSITYLFNNDQQYWRRKVNSNFRDSMRPSCALGYMEWGRDKYLRKKNTIQNLK